MSEPRSPDEGTRDEVPAAKQGYSVGTAKSKRAAAVAPPPRKGSGGGGRGRAPLIAGLALLGAAVAVGAFVLTRGDAPAVDAAAAAGCKVQDFAATGANDHLQAGEKPPKYDSDPPTHGRHDPEWALWGIYNEPVPQEKLIHNQEHGGLVVQWGDKVPAETVDAISAAILEDNAYTIAAVYPANGDRITFSTWSHLVTCPTWDKGVLDQVRLRRNVAPAPEVPQPAWADMTGQRQKGY